ncbi:MAG: hypothetical protein GC138_07545 [Gammaproteobacteria bacterium]|nr:hypothetical protein [Gammaproteobacteria bacterium]
MSETSPLQDAQQSFIDALPFATQAAETVALADALGRTLNGDVIAPEDMPPYHRAIVEGYLVRTEDTQGAAEGAPIRFRVVGEVNPGDETCPAIGNHEALRVVTGSLVNDGQLSIVRQWEALESEDGFDIERPFPPRFFIEDRGCDQAKGSVVVASGTRLGPDEIGVIAAHGITEVSVGTSPVVTLFSSGDEVIPYDQPLRPGQIRDSNALMLAAAVQEAGGTPKIAGIMSDDFEAFVAAAREALKGSDMLLVSGGTAVGGRDFIADLIREIGTLVVDGVPMRSGRPLIMGHAEGKPIVCVAGHPPEALRGFRLFGVAAIRRLLGTDAALPQDG